MEPLQSHSATLTHKSCTDQLRKDLEICERKNQRLSWANDDLRSKLFEVNQCGKQLSSNMGFKDIFEADQIVSQDPMSFNRVHIEHRARAFNQLTLQADDLRQSNSALHQVYTETLEMLQQLRKENDSLLQRRNGDRTGLEFRLQHKALPQTSGANNDSYIQRTIEPDAKLASLKVDLNELQHRYDTLLETKEKAAAMYKDDYKRWNDYKKWIRDHGILERKRKRGITGVESRGPSSHRSRKNRVSETSEKDDFQPREYVSSHSSSPERSATAHCNKENILTLLTESESNTSARKPASYIDSPGSNPSQDNIVSRSMLVAPDTMNSLKRKRLDPNQSSPPPKLENDLQGASVKRPPLRPPIPPSHTRTLKEDIGNYSMHDKATTSHVNDDDSKTLTLDSRTERRSAKRAALAPKSSTNQATGSRSIGRDNTLEYSEFKGRGRYAQRTQHDENTSINAQYQVHSARNGGLDFQYDAVVRNREERRHLEAGDCECCRDYYEAIGPLPTKLQQPLWRSPTNSPSTSRISQRLHTPDERNSDIAQHKKDISRHRHNWERAKTPPGYWNIGFPSTQEALDINEQAKEMHQEKLAMVEREAKKEGRYCKR